jgi:branched-chain amino acid transport system ATP-binding protein
MIEVSAISAFYGKHRALDGVTLHVGRGELVVILGANGAGKTTLLKVIGGLVPAAPGGRIVMAGKELMGVPAHDVVEAGVALVPEGRGIFGELTVRENLLLDEPSLGLSPIMCKELFQILARIRDAGLGILLVEQNAKQSLKIADRGYLIESGRIVGEGTGAALKADPAVQRAYLGAG